MNGYHINVFWSEEDGAWVADVPDLEYCSAHGATPVEVVRQVETAMAAWLDAARQAGKSIPEPRYRPAIYAAE
jgi:predicted RNase H-like HicB family nuclease